MTGTIVQISVSHGGLPKRAIPFGVVTPLGLEGDFHAHPNIHGGPEQALLLVTHESLEELQQLGYALFAGALGENLTLAGIDRRKLRAGQRFRAGSALIELTRLRRPCGALDVYGASLREAVFDAQAKAGDPTSRCWALAGFYARVVRPGEVRPGDPVELLCEAA